MLIGQVQIVGVEDAALFRSTDGAKTWQELPGLRGHGTGTSWQPGAGGMCLHTILLDPADPGRIFVVSADDESIKAFIVANGTNPKRR